MNEVEKRAALHCLHVMIDEAVCEECVLYGTTGTDHCEKDCVRMAITALENKTGHWIEHERDYSFWVECSVCHGKRRYGYEYCPDCGSHNGDMRKTGGRKV